MGFPIEHGPHTTLIAMRLRDRLGIDRSTASENYSGLLSRAGCTADAHVSAELSAVPCSRISTRSCPGLGPRSWAG